MGAAASTSLTMAGRSRIRWAAPPRAGEFDALKNNHDQALTPAQLRAYLERIGVDPGTPATREGLETVHRAHHFTIPFENFDVHLPAAYSFEPDHLFEKMVVRQRGGFCYEHNLLLAYALRAMGFRVDVMSGQMGGRKDGSFGPPFDHMALRVHLEDGDMLADVGNGETFQRPLPFDGTWTPQERGGEYRVSAYQGQPCVEYREGPGAPAEVRYLFDLTPRRPDEFLGMLAFHTTSEESRFTRGWICTLPRGADGRITVSRGMVMVTKAGKMERRALRSPQDLLDILVREFGMKPFDIPEGWFRREPAAADQG